MAVVKNMMVRAGADFSAFTTQGRKATKAMRDMQSGVTRACNSMKASVNGLKKVMSGLGIAVGVSAIIHAGREAAEAYDQQAEAEAKLAAVMRNTMGARNSEIQSILDLCSAQQRLGVLGDEVQIAGAQELATYLTQTSSLKKLIPVMNDMVAQQFGYAATAENAASVATMLGKVMSGQTKALSRYGYYFDEAQEKVLKYGTEAQRAAMLAEIVSDSVGGVNRQLASTPTGRMKQLNNVLGDIKEKFGESVRLIGVLLLPLLWKVADVLERIANFAARAAVSLNKVFGTAAALTGWQSGISGVTGQTGELTEELGEADEKAKKLNRTVAGFDDLNLLGKRQEDDSASSTSPAETPGSDIGSGLDLGLDDVNPEGIGWLEKLLQKVKDNAQAIKDTVLAIGAGLLTWKIASGLDLGLKTVLGLVAAVEGAVQLGINAFRAWNDGVDMSNLQGMLGGTIALCSGLGVAFGNVGAAIGLLIGSGAMLVTGMHEWITTGQLTHEASLAIAGGLIGIGAAISLLTGSWIPLLIFAVAGIGVAIYGYWDEISAWLSGIYEWISEWWVASVEPLIAGAVDWVIAAFQWIGQGFADFFGEVSLIGQLMWNFAVEVFTGIKNAITTAVTTAAQWLKSSWETIRTTTMTVFTTVSTTVTQFMSNVKTAITSAVSAAKTAAVTQWNAMLSVCRSVFSSIHSHITQTIQTATNYLASISWYSLGVNLMQGFLNGLKSLMSTIWNEVVAFVQRCTEAVRNALGVHSPSTVFAEIGQNLDEGLIVGMKSGLPELLRSGAEMAGSLADAVRPEALDVSGSYTVSSAPTLAAEDAYDSEDSMSGVLALLGDIYSAILEGKTLEIDGEAVFNTVVRENNRAISRTGMSPIRI